ncbi:MAG: uroporphyrinogen-III C-methyltransferase [Chloroflexi bacterium]|nr:uroporphyrinogen-III C-methyltransferase [Chloroflexota bacterium]
MGNDNSTLPLVALVGAGPGDPGLITVKGLARLQEADVVIYDALVSPELLEHTRQGAELIYAGKHPGKRHISQEAIHAALITHAKSGRRVVRLKGGDPFVFGRGGEEAEVLRAAGIPFEVIPGVSSAFAVPACVGIPLTHRECAANFAVVTGHRKRGAQGASQDWEALARMDTVVVLMGMHNLPQITAELISAGRAPSTPAAVIQWGTTPRQKVVTGTLADIAGRASELGSPATIVIGEVVSRKRDSARGRR